MDSLIETLQQYYNGDASTVYENARYRTWKDGNIVSGKLSAKNCKKVDFVSVDRISDRLASVQAEYYDEENYHKEVVGLIACKGTWKVVCALESVSKLHFCELYGDSFLQSNDIKDISDVLLSYCRDVYRMDADSCMDYFWGETRMYHPNEDETFTDVEIQILYQRWANHIDPIAAGIREYSRIFYVSMLDANLAVAKVGCAKLDNYFNDYLFLIRIQEDWKIVNKMTQNLHTGERI